MARRHSALIACTALLAVSCATSYDTFPLLNFDFPVIRYAGEIDDRVDDAGFGFDTAYGVQLAVGMRFAQTAIMLKGAFSSANASTSGPDLELELATASIQLDQYFPLLLGPSPKGKHDRPETVLSVLYCPYATLKDVNDEGWRNGSGFGAEAGITIPVEEGSFMSITGVGFRRLTFGTADVPGVDSGDTDRSLDVWYFFWRFEHRF
jgi:hypothetical protein